MGMMKVKVKTGLVVLFLLLLLGAFFAGFFPSEVMTSKWVMIGAQKNDVQKKLTEIGEWENWNLLMMSAKEVSTSKGSDTLKPGDKLAWTSAAGKKNEILITEITPDGIAMDINMEGEHPIHSGFSLAQRKDSVQVVWFIVEKLDWYPWEKIYGMMASDMKGPSLQYSLENFKKGF